MKSGLRVLSGSRWVRRCSMLWDYLKRRGRLMKQDGENAGQNDLRKEQEKCGNLRPDKMRTDTMIKSERIQIERKQFFFDFKENTSGRFLRITEDVGGHRDTIIVPATGLQLFRESLDHIIAVDAKTK